MLSCPSLLDLVYVYLIDSVFSFRCFGVGWSFSMVRLHLQNLRSILVSLIDSKGLDLSYILTVIRSRLGRGVCGIRFQLTLLGWMRRKELKQT